MTLPWIICQTIICSYSEPIHTTFGFTILWQSRALIHLQSFKEGEAICGSLMTKATVSHWFPMQFDAISSIFRIWVFTDFMVNAKYLFLAYSSYMLNELTIQWMVPCRLVAEYHCCWRQQIREQDQGKRNGYFGLTFLTIKFVYIFKQSPNVVYIF